MRYRRLVGRSTAGPIPDDGLQIEALGDKLPRLLRLVATSEYAAGILQRDWPWLFAAIRDGELDQPRNRPYWQQLQEQLTTAESTIEDTKLALRRVRHRELARIRWRELAGSADVWESLADLSQLADFAIEAGLRRVDKHLATRFGVPRGTDGDALAFVVLAMGKLGGNELNFSSDIDLVFLYEGDGESDGDRPLSAHEYFTRLARQLVAVLEDVTAEGFVYRVDTRLRPFGDSGPPVISFTAFENYLQQHGRSWERYAYVKARAAAYASNRVRSTPCTLPLSIRSSIAVISTTACSSRCAT